MSSQLSCASIAAKSAARVKRRMVASTLACLLASISAACVYDSAQRCSEHQVLISAPGTGESCVCDSQSAIVNGACVPCGTNEVPGPSGCICAAGFGRPNAGAVCAACGANEIAKNDTCECAVGFARSGPGQACLACGADCAAAGVQGAACDAKTLPCTDSINNYCYSRSGGAGYCTTQGCLTNAECSGGYACDTKVTPSVCRKPPDGMGKACTSNDQCAGTEATFCDSVVTHSCVVQGCSVSPDDCFPGYVCCDLAKFGLPTTLCSQGSCL